MTKAPQFQQSTIKKALSQAKKATKQKNITTALELYNTILQHQPSNHIAKKAIRKLQKGLEDEQSMQKQLINPSPDQINSLVNLYHSGRMSKTEQACKELIQSYPQSLIIINILGAVLQSQSKLDEAIKVYDKAILLKPDFEEPYSNRGVALQELGQINEAINSYDKAIVLKPDYVEAYSNRGNALLELGQLDKAIKSYDKAIQLKPDYAEAYSNRGNALQELGLLDEAIKSYNKAIQLKPDYAKAYSNLGVTLQELGQIDEAIKSYNTAIQLKPDYAEAYSNRGNALQECGQLNDAVKSYKQAIQLKPDYAKAYSNLGNALQELGQLDNAIESCEKAIQLKPDYAEAYRNLSTIKKYKPNDPQIEVMENLYTKKNLNDSDRTQLSFALAKAYENLAKYGKSFNYLKEGNYLRKKELGYKIDNDKVLVAKIRAIFNVKTLDSDIEADKSKPIQPIFIVGMPRSGTSLIEQILASHTRVHGAGELETMNKLINPILSNFSEKNIQQDKCGFSQKEANSVRNNYLKTLTELRVAEKIITDKMPLNFLWIGFILSAFPDAKVIHLNRNSRATCWSIYKHYFSVQGSGYAYDMLDLAEFYKLYIDLMSFWRERFPNNIYDLNYKNLTKNQEEETRKLIAFCDLEWDQQCLDFHKTQRAVKTASTTQVRKKMYQGSDEAWKHYEEYLQPLINALD